MLVVRLCSAPHSPHPPDLPLAPAVLKTCFGEMPSTCCAKKILYTVLKTVLLVSFRMNLYYLIRMARQKYTGVLRPL